MINKVPVKGIDATYDEGLNNHLDICGLADSFKLTLCLYFKLTKPIEAKREEWWGKMEMTKGASVVRELRANEEGG